MNPRLIHSLRTLLFCCALCCIPVRASAPVQRQNAIEDLNANDSKSKVTVGSPVAHSAAAAVNAPQSIPEAGFIVLFGSVLVALSAKARRGRQPF